MKHASARWLFVIGSVLALAAIVQDFRFDAAASQTLATSAALERQAGSLRVKVAELRAAQAAYVATGQGPEFWTRRAADLAADIESGLQRLRSDIRTPEAQAHTATASNALVELMSVDKRAKQAMDGEQRFLASDIVFAEGLASTQLLTDSISNAASTEVASLMAVQASASRVRLAMMPAAVLLVMGAGLVWARSRPKETAASAAAAMAQMLRELPPPVKAPGATPAQPARPVAVPPGVSASDLADAADLCVDLARILSPDDVQALLMRAAGVLGASGIVIWASDAEGNRLTPALWHGYNDRVIAKMGPLDATGDNITAVCFRTKRSQAMPGVGQPGGASAIAVPLLNAQGCHGVLAAELSTLKPAAEGVALARIIAAQFGAMVAPADDAAGSATAAG